MSNLSDFEHHFFLSYAHRDDQGDEGQRWVSRLRRDLELRLGDYLGFNARPWWDVRELRGNQDLQAELVTVLGAVATLVPILSPSYMQSTWCAFELERFQTIAELERIFKVLKMEVPLAEQPEILRRQLGYAFLREEPQTGRKRQLDPEEDSRDYKAKVDDLAQDLAALLKRSTDPGSGKTIYLAECSSDVESQRERLRRILEQRGHRLVPVVPLLSLGPGEKIRERIRADLEGCDLAIHLLGKRYGAWPEGEELGLPALQHALCGASGVGQLVWIPPERQNEEKEQADFLDDLLAAPGKAQILRRSIEDLAQYVEERLQPAPAVRSADQVARSVYVVCTPRDAESEVLGRLCDALTQAGLRVLLPEVDSDLRADHKEQLTHCDGLLIFHGAGGTPWLRQKLSDVEKSLGYRKGRDWAAMAVLRAPAEGEETAFPQTRLEQIDCRQGFSPQLLATFLSNLQGMG